jgi:hypothetical protein
MSRSSGFCCAIILHLLMAGCGAPAKKDASELEGRWRNVRGTIYFSDGTSSTPTRTPCSIEFSGKRSVSECATNAGTSRIVYAYRSLGPQKYETEVIEHKDLPHLVGTRVRTDFRITSGTLFTTSYPPAPPGASRFAVKIESTWVRE